LVGLTCATAASATLLPRLKWDFPRKPKGPGKGLGGLQDRTRALASFFFWPNREASGLGVDDSWRKYW